VPDLAIVIPTLNERANVPLLISRLSSVLEGIAWEAIFVDDDSADGTIDAIRSVAGRDPRIRGIRRISRRGLSGAALEGMLSTSAQFVAVMDGDLQHDETHLVEMLAILRNDHADVVVASRYYESGQGGSGFSRIRQFGSRFATHLGHLVLRQSLSDPMSGFFMLRREIVDQVARELSPQGFKILLDVIVSSPHPLRIAEVPIVFRPRLHGASKLDGAVVLEYLGLLVSKASGGLLSIRLFMFGLVGSTGIAVHLSLLATLLGHHMGFAEAQTAAMLGAMISNYSLNNAFTYRDRRRHGWRFFSGLASFCALCSLGLFAGVGVSTLLYQDDMQWWLAGLAGALMGAMWNYVTSSAITWR
jgi:dolichol-phosphate mannosyltransferase